MSAIVVEKPMKKWWEIYQGDKECRFFKALCFGKFDWRTTDGICKEAKLSQNDVENICAKYLQVGVVQQHAKSPDKWRYWERAPKKKPDKGISGSDKERRIRGGSTPNQQPTTAP